MAITTNKFNELIGLRQEVLARLVAINHEALGIEATYDDVRDALVLEMPKELSEFQATLLLQLINDEMEVSIADILDVILPASDTY
jgi:hypothetical protein